MAEKNLCIIGPSRDREATVRMFEIESVSMFADSEYAFWNFSPKAVRNVTKNSHFFAIPTVLYICKIVPITTPGTVASTTNAIFQQAAKATTTPATAVATIFKTVPILSPLISS